MARRFACGRWALALALVVCVGSPAAMHAQTAAPRADAPDPDADNTGVNVRDRDGTTLTPLDQGNSPSDVAITRHVRQAVVANDNLSTNAHNVKIITIDGVVTLRGPVKSAEEREFIVAAAKSAPQVKRVNDQIAIEAE